MELKLKRTIKSDKSTIGSLTIDNQFYCNTLEDVVRAPGVKIPGETAIPAGRYQVTVTRSPKFKRDLPLLLDVPGFEGIRIHPGNKAADTEGCLLVGHYDPSSPDWISESRKAFEPLMDRISEAVKKAPVYIMIEG